jgi:hypothetical protein
MRDPLHALWSNFSIEEQLYPSTSVLKTHWWLKIFGKIKKSLPTNHYLKIWGKMKQTFFFFLPYQWQGCNFKPMFSTHSYSLWEFFYVPHLLQHGTSVYAVSSAPTSHSGIQTHYIRTIRSLCYCSIHCAMHVTWYPVRTFVLIIGSTVYCTYQQKYTTSQMLVSLDSISSILRWSTLFLFLSIHSWNTQKATTHL